MYKRGCREYAVLLPGSWCERDGKNMQRMPDKDFTALVKDLQVRNLPKQGEKLKDMQMLPIVDVAGLQVLPAAFPLPAVSVPVLPHLPPVMQVDDYGLSVQ